MATFGCTANQSSSEILEAKAVELGHRLVSEREADVIICNTCTVKDTTEQKILHKIKEWGLQGREVIVTGCMPQVQMDEILENNPEVHVLGMNSLLKLGVILNRVHERLGGLSLRPMSVFDDSPEGLLNVPRNRSSPNIHICQISQGCNNRCSYCIVTLARGPLYSFDADSIVTDIEQAVYEGCSEIWLTSQDNAQYGLDKGINLPALLERITAIPGDFRLRVGMMNPTSTLGILDELLQAYSSEKVYKVLHLPIQSASDKVLEKMRRKHTMEQANFIVEKFRDTFPESTLFTDIIVGFPGEDEEDFELTLDWIRTYRPDKVNISRYTPRPHTEALQFRNIDTRIVVERSGKLHRLCNQIKLGKKEDMVGKEVDVFISQQAKVKGLMSRTASYKPVVIPESGEFSPGQRCRLKIDEATPGYFIGHPV
ncbi:MAG: 2-methylthioadenine synthetase [Methanohalophilus sp. DAL1]|nr:tRNA (N(6)-L-threonylcarbamoyladenosine(37)-C(2))-methylthiotransferase [Methanohalophilus sp. DAL1]OBZ35596.1 MAG: 2-methylthioadenine synthetase [Methanohalophilus sp. DAL1]